MIHAYQLNGYNIVLDVNSGAVHVVDDILYHMLQKMPNTPDAQVPQQYPEQLFAALESTYSKAEMQSAYQDIYDLWEKGQLFSSDDYEQFANMMVSAPIKAMCLNVAHDCNLRCKYCFASTGEYGSGRKLMDIETGKRAIDFLLKYSGTRKNLEMDFFGGEPLMNFDLVKEVVKYARSKEKEYNKNFRFTITTNGVLLTEDKMDFISLGRKQIRLLN